MNSFGLQAWQIYALGSAIFAALTAILAKIGIKGVDSNLATAIRTVVILVFAWAIVWAQGTANQLRVLEPRTLLFLVLSGLATGASLHSVRETRREKRADERRSSTRWRARKPRRPSRDSQ